MKKYLKIVLGLAFCGVVIFGIGRDIVHAAVQQIPIFPANFETSLEFPIGATDTSLTLVNGTSTTGVGYSGYACFTVDTGQPNSEYMCGTENQASVTNLTRGIDIITGTSTNPLLEFSHRRGADVRITDFPWGTIVSSLLNGQIAFPNLISYATNTATTTTSGSTIPDIAILNGSISNLLGSNNSWTGTNAYFNTATYNSIISVPYNVASSSAASVGYVNATAFSGVSNANLTTKGIVQEAAPTDINAGTLTGTTGAVLFVSPQDFSNSNYASTSKIYYATSSAISAYLSAPVAKGDVVSITANACATTAGTNPALNFYTSNFNSTSTADGGAGGSSGIINGEFLFYTYTATTSINIAAQVTTGGFSCTSGGGSSGITKLIIQVLPR